MFTITLPKYTSERFYLLSEIECRANIYSCTAKKSDKSHLASKVNNYVIDHSSVLEYTDSKLNSYEKKISPTENSNSDEFLLPCEHAVYFAWDVKSGFEEFQRKISNITALLLSKNIHDQMQNGIVCVEVYDSMDDNTETLIKLAYDYISKTMLSDRVRVFGVSNVPNGTCALEVLMDYCNGISGPDETAKKITVITSDEFDYLGFEVTNETDAEGNVNQYLLSSMEGSIKDWAQSMNPIERSNDTTPMSHPYGSKASFTVFISVLVLLLAYMVAVILSRLK